MAIENPAASADKAPKKAAPKKAAQPKTAAPKKAATPKPAAPAADAQAAPAPAAKAPEVAKAEAAAPTPLQVGQKVRWYHNGSENLPQNNYEATISELPHSNGLASLSVSIEGEVQHRKAARQLLGEEVAANAAFFIAE